jgi:oxalate decarboxylase/phosphoglucose isomerase-like protein (cupin superfamily)
MLTNFMRLKTGGVRELHWHKQAEWSIMLAGNARITAVDNDGKNFIADVAEGDLWYFPAGIPHSVQASVQEVPHLSRRRCLLHEACDVGKHAV